jgi:hypothetical protein
VYSPTMQKDSAAPGEFVRRWIRIPNWTLN